jgi:hypothetical protein
MECLASRPPDLAGHEDLLSAVTPECSQREHVANGRVCPHVDHDVDPGDRAARVPAVACGQSEVSFEVEARQGSEELVPDLAWPLPHRKTL